MTGNASGAGRQRDLDGLRGIAVLLVILLHYVVRSGFFYDLGPQRIALLLDSSWSGVDIFFVLSGFLIGGIIIDNGRAANFLQVFYARRLLRIVPVAFVAYAFSFLVLMPLDPSASTYVDVPPFAYFLFINNFWTALGHQAFAPLGPMWSLAIEQQFYLVVPTLALLVGARTRLAMMAAIIFLSPLLRISDLGFSSWDFTLFRLDGFAVGITVASLSRDERAVRFFQQYRRTLNALVAGLVLMALLFASSPRYSPAQHVAFGISLNSLAAGGIIFLLQVSPGSALSNALSQSWLVLTGRYSYFIYVMHMPIFTYVVFGYMGASGLLYPLLALALTYAGAWASWRFLESKMISIGRRFSYVPCALTAGAAAPLSAKSSG